MPWRGGMFGVTPLRALAVVSFVPSVLLVVFCWSQVAQDGEKEGKESLHRNLAVIVDSSSKTSSDGLFQQQVAQITPSAMIDRSGEPSIHNLNSTDFKLGTSSVNITEPLSPGIINGIKKFVFIVGYAGSGYSIIGTLLDTHPHVVISDGFGPLSGLGSNPPRENLYSLLYSRSKRDVRRSKGDSVVGLWQGMFDRYIDVIGDKNGSVASTTYSMGEEEFLRHYKELKTRFSIPIRIIHTVRNPFDLISTNLVRNLARRRESERITPPKKDGASSVENSSRNASVEGGIQDFFQKIDSATRLTEVFGKPNVLDVHMCDLVDNPGVTLSEIFNFLGVDATERYLDACAEKVYKSVSRSRNMVGWTPEQIEEVERGMKKYVLFDRYDFFSN